APPPPGPTGRGRADHRGLRGRPGPARQRRLRPDLRRPTPEANHSAADCQPPGDLAPGRPRPRRKPGRDRLGWARIHVRDPDARALPRLSSQRSESAFGGAGSYKPEAPASESRPKPIDSLALRACEGPINHFDPVVFPFSDVAVLVPVLSFFSVDLLVLV